MDWQLLGFPAIALAWEPGGRWAAHGDARCKVWIERVDGDDQPSRPVAELGTATAVESLSVSRDGRWLACGQASGRVTVWQVDIARKDGWRVVSEGSAAVGAATARTLVAFSPVDDTLAVAHGTEVSLLRLDVDALTAPERGEPSARAATPEPATITALSISLGADGRSLSFVVAAAGGRLTLRQDWRGLDALFPEIGELDRLAGAPADPDRATSLVRSLREEATPSALVDSRAIAQDLSPVALDIAPPLAFMPWELLLASPAGMPLGVSRGLVRRPPADLRPPPPSDGIALVIDLLRDDGDRSSGEEADGVQACVEASSAFGQDVVRLRLPSANETFAELLRRPIRLLSIAGQGIWQPGQRSTAAREAAIVLGDGAFLDAGSLVGPHTLPEIVHLGAAYLARTAPQLIERGARVVVAPIWHVGPVGARLFCGTFFESLFAGDLLVVATRKARAATHAGDPGSTAWAAYQVHGDPAYRFERRVAPGASFAARAPVAERGAAARLRDLAALYAQTRRTVAAGDERTATLTDLAKRIGTLVDSVEPDMAELVASNSPGDMLVATIVLQRRFDRHRLDWLLSRLTEDHAFLALQAANALLAGVNVLDDADLPDLRRRLEAILETLTARGLLDGGVHRALDRVVSRINGRLRSAAAASATVDAPTDLAEPARAGYRFLVITLGEDAAAMRGGVEAALRELGHAVVDATSSPPRRVVGPPVTEVADADVVVLVVGASAPADANLAADGPSIAEMMYEEAMRLFKPVLVFIRNAAKEPVAQRSEGAGRRFHEFKTTLVSNHVAQAFSTADNLEHNLLREIHRLPRMLPRSLRRIAEPQASADPPSPEAAAGPEPRWVMVAGTGRRASTLAEAMRDICEALGTGLAGAGFGLVTGGWLGVDELVSRSFAAECARLGIATAARVRQVLEPGEIPAVAIGTRLTMNAGKRSFAESVQHAQALVILGGEGGTMQLARAARAAGRVVLPLAGTGGDAADFHAELLQSSNPGATAPGGLDGQELEQLAATTPDVVAAVLRILARIGTSSP